MAQREKKQARGATTRRLAIRARETERERGSAGEENLRRQIGLTGQRARKVGRARGKTTADRRGLPIGRRARDLAGLSGPTGLLFPFLFLWIF
jgi:hypothetical protein